MIIVTFMSRRARIRFDIEDNIWYRTTVSKTVIISDCHHRIAKIDAILTHEPHDRAVLLGDNFDMFDDVPEDAYRTAVWLKASLARSERTHFMGNHDQSYGYSPNRRMRCSGFTTAKDMMIWQVLDRAAFDKLSLYHVSDGVLLSHAGFSSHLMKSEMGKGTLGLDETITYLAGEMQNVREKAHNDGCHVLMASGWSRGGSERHGGLTWCDFDTDFLATSFPQIVGHTPHPHPLFHLRRPRTSKVTVKRASDTTALDLLSNWWALDLDTYLNHYAIIEGGVLTIKEVSWGGLGKKHIGRTVNVFSAPIS